MRLCFSSVKTINLENQGESFWVRGYLQNVRAKSKLAFLLLRQEKYTIQGILNEVHKLETLNNHWE